MTSTSDRSRASAVEPTEFSTAFIRASFDASQKWTRIYLDTLERAVDWQLKVVEQYASTGGRHAAAVAERAASGVAVVTRTAEGAARTPAKTGGEVAKVAAKTAEKVAKTQTATAAAEEPLAGYGELTAEQIVAKLPTVSQRTLARVGVYERKHQGRATVLTRVEALTAKEPTRGYDELTVADVEQLLKDGDEDLAKRVRDYERTHGARSGVLQAAERRLARS